MLDRPLAGLQLADGQERDVLARGLGALRDGIELPDAFERIAEKVEPAGARMAGREQVDNAAAHRVFAGLHHGARPVEARCLKPAGQLLHLKPAAGGNPRGGFFDRGQRRHTLEYGVYGREHDQRGLAALRMRKPGQGGDAPCLDVAVGRDAVVGNAIPGREAQDVGTGCEELKLRTDGREPMVVAGDVQHRLLELRIGRQPPRDGREQEGVIPFRHARGNNGALAAREPVQRRGRFHLICCVFFDCHARLLPAFAQLQAPLTPTLSRERRGSKLFPSRRRPLSPRGRGTG